MGKRHKSVLFVSGSIQLWQWAIGIYVISQTSKGTDLPAVLLSRHADLPLLPTLPSIDPYHCELSHFWLFSCLLTTILLQCASLLQRSLCKLMLYSFSSFWMLMSLFRHILIHRKPWVEAYLYLSLTFDALAFMSLLFLTMRASRLHYISRMIKVIRNDGISVGFRSCSSAYHIRRVLELTLGCSTFLFFSRPISYGSCCFSMHVWVPFHSFLVSRALTSALSLIAAWTEICA